MAQPTKEKHRPNNGTVRSVNTFVSNVFAGVLSGTLSGLLVALILKLLEF